ncbi:MAG: Flp pilus assembly protein CpaB [Caulobacterales bacterium 68-7]|nr:Flp pilus assembly protein CpaB [Caulobacterales bacterium]OJU09697.1 MAG: Flp pilus assembly protein CpaB [Caulobacterales bacterium 68-7]
MSPARVLIIVIAAVAAIGCALLLRGALGGKADAPAPATAERATTRVLVAKRDLGIGDRLQPSDLGWQEWPADALNPNLITDGAAPVKESERSSAAKVATAAGDMIGGAGPMQTYQGSIVREPILNGEPILARKLVRDGEGGFLSVVLAPGKRAIALPVTVDAAAGGFILPGDHVDVLRSREVDQVQAGGGGQSTKDEFIAETVLTNLRVLAIDQATEVQKGAKSLIGATATLEVGPSDAEVLTRAKAQGSLVLALRSITDSGGFSGAARAEPRQQGDIVRIHRAGATEVVGVRP